MKSVLIAAATSVSILLAIPTGVSAEIAFNKKVSLKVGQSIVLKGVRGDCDAKRAPAFSNLRRLPRPKTGVLKDGGAGTVTSDSCKKKVPARAIKFKATKPGKERITIYRDKFSITVK